MWIGDAIYFQFRPHRRVQSLRYDVATRQTKQITHYQSGMYAAQRRRRWPDRDESDGELHIYDTRDGQ